MILKPFKVCDQEYRKRQIDTLKVFNANVTQIIENEEYSMHFNSAGRTFRLKVHLGSNFPNEKPKIILYPPVQHNWINSSNGEVEMAPGLLNFSQHSELGRVVQAIIREFERFPPPLLDEGSPSTTRSTVTPTANNFKKNSLLKCLVSTRNYSFLNLSTLSLDKLNKLDSDPDFFDDFVEEMAVVQDLNGELDSMINQVEIISRENGSKESILRELKHKIKVDVNALKILGEKCDKLNQRYLKKSQEFAPQHIRELLQIAASNSDTECEKHVELFLDGKIDVQKFLNSYTYSKQISSERKAKEERLGHQLNALEKASI